MRAFRGHDVALQAVTRTGVAGMPMVEVGHVLATHQHTDGNGYAGGGDPARGYLSSLSWVGHVSGCIKVLRYWLNY